MVYTNPKTGREYTLGEIEISCLWGCSYKAGYLSGSVKTVTATRESWGEYSYRLDLPTGEIVIKSAKSVLAAKRAITRLMRCAGMRDTQGR
jgi:hypothetical protein